MATCSRCGACHEGPCRPEDLVRALDEARLEIARLQQAGDNPAREAAWAHYLDLRRQIRHAAEAERAPLMEKALAIGREWDFEPPADSGPDEARADAALWRAQEAGWYAAERGEGRDTGPSEPEPTSTAWLDGWEWWHLLEQDDPDEARADERAMIVAWLRTDPETTTLCDGHRHADGQPCAVLRPLTLDEAADAIESGEYNSPDRGEEPK